MAETIARRGGIAIIPQDIPLDVVASTVRRVKAAHVVYDTPVTVSPTTTVGEAMSLLPKRAHGAVVVVEDGKVLGIVTERDGADIDRFAQVSEVMTGDVTTFEVGADPSRCFDEMTARHMAVAPVLDGGQLVGVLTRKGALRSTIYQPAVDHEGRLVIGAAVGINGDVAAKSAALLKLGIDVLVVDTAHGHQSKMLEALPDVVAVAGRTPQRFRASHPDRRRQCRICRRRTRSRRRRSRHRQGRRGPGRHVHDPHDDRRRPSPVLRRSRVRRSSPRARRPRVGRRRRPLSRVTLPLRSRPAPRAS